MTKVRKSLFIFSALIIIASGYIVYDYYRWGKFVREINAGGSCAVQDGGNITKVMPCVLDTPANYPVTCEASCPLVTPVFETACAGYTELDTQSQQGTTFLAVPKGFVYKGGGTTPTMGMQYLYCGSSNAYPWVIGIPGVAKNNTDRVFDWFRYIIAGFKDKIK
ncbi:MAG: hypothetical protein WCW77_01365 [Patescibacteria group bacterium]|jgi:hypothetical protein